MSSGPRITLLPLGKVISGGAGEPLQDRLFKEGIEFPCGGKGRCKGCRARLLDGDLPPSEADHRHLSATQLAEGWRLLCQAKITGDLTLELAQWEMPVLTDHSTFEFHPRAGFGIAIDLGTTTIAAQLLDLARGEVLAVETALNAQSLRGADIMSRLEFALTPGGLSELTTLIREQLFAIVRELCSRAGKHLEQITDIVVVGNTAMQQLACGLEVRSLAQHPFESSDPSLHVLSGPDLGWRDFHGSFRFLPSLGGFVGSDLLAGILATGIHHAKTPAALIDLGTNGEILVGNRDRILCASTAAGPAFEGARISCGMRAATGAISEVRASSGRLVPHVLGGGPPRGICGSGLVDAVSAGLELALLRKDGRFTGDATTLELAPTLHLLQRDIRELQLAKAAIAAGLRILLEEWGTSLEELDSIYLAGAFGNYINRASAYKIGLLPLDSDKIVPVGNSALLGAKLALFAYPEETGRYSELLARVKHVSLNENPGFQDIFVEELNFRPTVPMPVPP